MAEVKKFCSKSKDPHLCHNARLQYIYQDFSQAMGQTQDQNQYLKRLKPKTKIKTLKLSPVLNPRIWSLNMSSPNFSAPQNNDKFPLFMLLHTRIATQVKQSFAQQTL